MKPNEPLFWEHSGILRETRFKAALSGGKGGQNVNKVSTKIELYWNPSASTAINEDTKNVLLHKLQNKLSTEGELRIVCEEERSQLKNKQKAIEKFFRMLTACFKEVKPRKATKPTRSSVNKRLDEKSRKKTIKHLRNKPDYD